MILRIGWGSADGLEIEKYYPEEDAWFAIAYMELEEHGGQPTDEQLEFAKMVVRCAKKAE